MSSAPRGSHARAHPSLALIKYWGKQDSGINIPATSSLAVTLEGLRTDTWCSLADDDSVTIDGEPRAVEPFAPFFDQVRGYLREAGVSRGNREPHFSVVSENSFPTAAGLASSASGFAALAVATVAAAGGDTSDRPGLSALARVGSGSASRSVFGGFVAWRAGSPIAEALHPPSWWEDLRVVVLPVESGPKAISSRDAMNRTRDTSPFYGNWVSDAPVLFERALAALESRDIETLGGTMRESTMRMFATMLGAKPPIRYWRPATIAVLDRLEAMRRSGIPAWETMDAGPQVKVLTVAEHVDRVLEELRGWCALPPIVARPGNGAELIEP